VIGPQKAANGWIDKYLRTRDDVCVTQGVRETYFFDSHYHRGIKWYAKHFRDGKGTQRVIEVAPTYFHSRKAPERIRRDLGLIPLVCTLRHPAERAFSLYLHLRRCGLARGTFRDAVAQVSRNPASAPVLESSRYASNLKRWIDVFGKERILVLFLDALSQDHDRYVHALCDHLGLPSTGVDSSLHGRVNEAALPISAHLARAGLCAGDVFRWMGFYGVIEAAKKAGLKRVFFGRPGDVELPRMSDEDRTWFLSQLGHEVEDLEELLGISLPHWKAA